jgi:hypothetical protein
MEIESLSDLNPGKEIGIVINVNTKLLTTLALMSALKYCDMPLLVIDCRSRDGSYKHFLNLMESHEFDLMSAELMEHGRMLDWIFTNISFERVLLIDSDIEILGEQPVELMRKGISPENVFGSGFIHEGQWMNRQKMRYAYYEERAWIPFVLFKVRPVREAIDNGKSFSAKKIYNDFPGIAFISKLLGKRLYIPFFRNLKLSRLDSFRREYHGIKPSLIYNDTGAILYRYLKDSSGYKFSAIPWEVNWKNILHFHGVTRLQLNVLGRNGTRLRNIDDYIKHRLEKKYGLIVDR